MKYYAVTDDPNELMHFGIKGMRWGIRRTDAQLGHPRHTGSRRPRSAAYKKASAKLSSAMRNGINKAKANWRAYNSPQAKEKRFMDKAMQQARNGTLKYGKLTDAQVQKITDRLYLERQARQLGSTEQPRYSKRLKMAVGEGIVKGIGMGTASYINARFEGRGKTTAEIKRDKRMAKYEGREDVQRRRALNKQTEEFYKTTAEEGDNPYNWRYTTSNQRAKYLANVKKRNKESEYKANIQKVYDEQEARNRANNDAKSLEDTQRGIRAHREERKLSPSKVEYLDPHTKKKKIGSALQALNAWNEVREDIDKYGNAYYDSLNTSLAKIKADEARAREQAKRDQAFNESLRNKQRQDAARESARIQREQERQERLEKASSSRPSHNNSSSSNQSNKTGRSGPWAVRDAYDRMSSSEQDAWRAQNDWRNTSDKRKRHNGRKS